MKTGLQLRTAQTLNLTPQLQQSIRLLQLSGLELHEALQHMMAKNPFLEPDVDDFETTEISLDNPPQIENENTEPWQDNPSIVDTCTLFSDNLPATDIPSDTNEIVLDNWSERITYGEHHLSSDDRQEHNSSNSELHIANDTSGWSGEGSCASGNEEHENTTDSDAQAESLYDYLHQQTLSLRLNDIDRMALYCLIESLTEDGYLEDSLGEVAEVLLHQIPENTLPEANSLSRDETQFELLHYLTVALRLLQTLEPVGVGARDLGECIRLQLKALHIEDNATEALLVREIALSLCQQPSQYLARRDVRGLQKITGFPAAHIQTAMQLIATLEPKPGRRFSSLQHHLITPDVLVHRDEKTQQWIVRINPAVLPKVRVQEMYAQALRQHSDSSNSNLQQHLQEARWMIKSLQQRFDTILRVSKTIVQHQAGFFAHGVQSMQPLILRAIADELNMHESTISRVSNGKYMTTPWGTFELKFFFSSALETEGGSASSTAVRALLQELIGQENPQKPLSDKKLSELLKKQGIQCARRTVAKYREALQIPPAHLRRSLQ